MGPTKLISFRCELETLACLDRFPLVRSRVIGNALVFFTKNVTVELWRRYCYADYSKRREAWKAFWTIIKS